MSPENHDANARAQLGKVIDGLRTHLLLQKDEGAQRLEVHPRQMAGLRASPRRPAARPSRPATPPARPEPARSPSPAAAAAASTASDTGQALADIAARVAGCTRCPLCQSRTRTVPGQGHEHPEIAFVGEGPGADEDRTGLAFVGRAGQLLTRIIEAMGLTRDQVWIGNIVKCRPPGNRTPLPDEMEACLPYLKEQIALLKPRIIVCLGATAVKGLLQASAGITKLRGTWMSFEGTDVMPTYHPAYLLRNPAGKREVWEDMQAVLARLGREPPPRGGRRSDR